MSFRKIAIGCITGTAMWAAFALTLFKEVVVQERNISFEKSNGYLHNKSKSYLIDPGTAEIMMSRYPHCSSSNHTLSGDSRSRALAVPYYDDDLQMQNARPEIFWQRPRVAELRRDPHFYNQGVFYFQNAFVGGDHAAILDCQSLFVVKQCERPSHKQAADQISSSDRRVIAIEGAAVLIYQYFGNEYFHSTIECLPRIATMLDYLQANPNATILAPRALQSNAHEWNTLMNLTNPWMEYNPRNHIYHVRSLWVPGGSKCGQLDPVAGHVVQTRLGYALASRIVQQEANTTQSILGLQQKLVVLQKRKTRRILNHEDLKLALETFCLDHSCRVKEFVGTESLTQTALLHHRADVVVGPHGAGMANLIYRRVHPMNDAEELIAERSRSYIQFMDDVARYYQISEGLNETTIGGLLKQEPSEQSQPLSQIRFTALVELHPTFGNWASGLSNQCHQGVAQSLGMYSIQVRQQDGSTFGDFSVNVSAAVSAVADKLEKIRQSDREFAEATLR